LYRLGKKTFLGVNQMKYIFGIFVLICPFLTLGDSFGLRKLNCIRGGESYQVHVGENTVDLIVKSSDSDRSPVTHKASFAIEDCSFEPFTVSVSCMNHSKREFGLKVRIDEVESPSRHFLVSFDIDEAEAIESRIFSTHKVYSGKSSVCTVNDTFEIL
jgi:hypothetical protein